MSEWTLGLLASLRLLLVVLFATCYWVGGRKWKPIRRFLGGALLAGGTLGLMMLLGHFKPMATLSLLVLPAALSLGYGGDKTATKLWRRALYGAAVALSGLPLALASGRLGLFFFQAPIALWASCYLGVLNPAWNAEDEETLIATAMTFVVPFYA